MPRKPAYREAKPQANTPTLRSCLLSVIELLWRASGCAPLGRRPRLQERQTLIPLLVALCAISLLVGCAAQPTTPAPTPPTPLPPPILVATHLMAAVPIATREPTSEPVLAPTAAAPAATRLSPSAASSPTYTPPPTQTPRPTPAPTDTRTPTPVPQLVSTSNVNIRSGPDTAYPIVGAAQIGDRFPVTGRNASSTWWQIEYKQGQAWIFGDLVTTEGVQAITIVTAVPPPPTAVPPPVRRLEPDLLDFGGVVAIDLASGQKTRIPHTSLFTIGTVDGVVLVPLSSTTWSPRGERVLIAHRDYQTNSGISGGSWRVSVKSCIGLLSAMDFNSGAVTDLLRFESSPAVPWPSAYFAIQLALWSPDGHRIAFQRNYSASYQRNNVSEVGLYLVNADGSGLRRVLASEVADNLLYWSTDGRWLATRSSTDNTLYVVEVDGERRLPLTQIAGLQFYDERYSPWRVLDLGKCRPPGYFFADCQ